MTSRLRPSAPGSDSASQNGAGKPPVRLFGRPIKRRWPALLLAVVAVLALLLFEVPQFLSPAPSTAGSKTIWQSITAGIADSIVPRDTALEAFAYLYKVDVPGVKVPAGPDGADAPRSGTGVMRWVRADWSQFTAAQQAVISRFMAPATTRGTARMTPAPSAAFAPARFGNRPGLTAGQVAAYDPQMGPWQRGPVQRGLIGWPFITNVPADVSPDFALSMADDMAGIIVGMGPKLGLPVILPGPSDTPGITLTFTDLDGGKALMDTYPTAYGNGGYSPCNVTVYKNTWSNQAWLSGTTVTPTMHVLLAHEIVHCYQNVAIGDIYNAAKMPSWIMEGSADYLAVDYTGTIGPGDAGAWDDYMIPEIALTTRTYDAMGWFALLAHKGRDLWGTIAHAWAVAGHSLQRSDDFIGVLHGDDSDILDSWAQSYANNTSWNDPWILYGTGAPKTGAVGPIIKALPEPGWQGTLSSRSNTLLTVTETSGEVVTVGTGGLASVHDLAGHSAMNFQVQNFCTIESCVCPPGTALAGQDMAPSHLNLTFIAAINAPEAGADWTVIGSKLEDLCKRRSTPQPSASAAPHGPCGSACTQSNGDPHMTTVNKYRYDFQAAGEFTLLRTPDSSIDIQARQEPYGTSGIVSINTAIAARVGTHKVGVYVITDGLAAHVDGKLADLSGGPIDLGNGARLSTVDRGFEIDFPDGTKMWALSTGGYGINAQIRPSPALLTHGQGLLGFVIPGGLGVPALSDGTRLPAAANEAGRSTTLYGRFADAWRISQTTSLFDYDPGRTTDTYTIRPYPTNTSHAGSTGLSSSQQAAGQSACSAVTDPDLHDQCTFDVGVTGQTGFAGSYQATQTFYDNGIVAGPTPTPTPAARPSFTAAPTSGNFWTIPTPALGGFAQGSDDTVYLSIQTADNAFSLVAFDPAAGKVKSQVPVPALTAVHVAAGSVWLPGLETDANGHNCSVTRFDGATLAKVATIAVPCTFDGGPGRMASDGASIWFMDTTKYDLGTKVGAVFTRIDPATNAPATGATDSVAITFIGGYTVDSRGAFFYADSDPGYLMLPTGATSFVTLGKFPGAPPRPGGAGLWVQSNTSKSAVYYTSPGTPAGSVDVGGSLVAGDTKAAYVEVLGNNAVTGNTEEQLWRYPLDGSAPTQIATGPDTGGGELSYFGDPMPLANGNGFLKVWATRDQNGKRVVVLQWTPVK